MKTGLAREAFRSGQQSVPGHYRPDLNRLSFPINSPSSHQGFVFLFWALATACPVLGAVLINLGIHLPLVRSVLTAVPFRKQWRGVLANTISNWQRKDASREQGLSLEHLAKFRRNFKSPAPQHLLFFQKCLNLCWKNPIYLPPLWSYPIAGYHPLY